MERMEGHRVSGIGFLAGYNAAGIVNTSLDAKGL